MSEMEKEKGGKVQSVGGSGLEDTARQVQSNDLRSRDKVDGGAAAGGSLRMTQTIRKA